MEIMTTQKWKKRENIWINYISVGFLFHNLVKCVIKKNGVPSSHTKMKMQFHIFFQYIYIYIYHFQHIYL